VCQLHEELQVTCYHYYAPKVLCWLLEAALLKSTGTLADSLSVMGRKRDRKQANMALGGGASGRRVKLDLWTPDPIAEARKAKEAAPAAAVASATGMWLL
jgi:hypothetical protein